MNQQSAFEEWPLGVEVESWMRAQLPLQAVRQRCAQWMKERRSFSLGVDRQMQGAQAFMTVSYRTTTGVVVTKTFPEMPAYTARYSIGW